MSGNPYNGFSWSQRMDKFKEMRRRFDAGTLKKPAGPCQLCNQPAATDGSITFEYHDEDYGHDYSWSAPAAYVLCRGCHIYRLHQRFARPLAWQVFLAHVRRGSYGSDLKLSAVQTELARYRRALAEGGTLPALDSLRPYGAVAGKEWFANLSTDPALIAGQAG